MVIYFKKKMSYPWNLDLDLNLLYYQTPSFILDLIFSCAIQNCVRILNFSKFYHS